MPILDTSLHSLKRIYRGKVRDSYELDDDKLLIIATDRISAFDVILDDPIPYKGMVLQALTDFWFEKLKGIVPNHLTGIDPTTVVAPDEVEQVRGRSVVAMKLKPIPIECVVRGYIAGGGWKDYKATGKVCGVELPAGLQQAQKLPQPIFTPAAKMEVGKHDENISFEQAVSLVGEDVARKIRDYSIELYTRAAEYALTQGIIIADTKFEFGMVDVHRDFILPFSDTGFEFHSLRSPGTGQRNGLLSRIFTAVPPGSKDIESIGFSRIETGQCDGGRTDISAPFCPGHQDAVYPCAARPGDVSCFKIHIGRLAACTVPRFGKAFQ